MYTKNWNAFYVLLYFNHEFSLLISLSNLYEKNVIIVAKESNDMFRYVLIEGCTRFVVIRLASGMFYDNVYPYIQYKI